MIPVFPLGHAYLPGEQVSLNVFEPRYLQLFADLTASGGEIFGTVLIERGSEVGGGDRRFGHGVLVRVSDRELSPVGLRITGRAVGRMTVTRWGTDDPYPVADIDVLSFAETPSGKRLDAASALTVLAQSVRSMLARHGVTEDETDLPVLRGLGVVASGHWYTADPTAEDLDTAVWAVARCIPCGPLDRHALLVRTDLPEQVSLLRRVVEHTDEILAFRGQ